MNTNRLKGSRAYLAGYMEHGTDGGATWRIKLQKTLSDLKIIWLDPTQKPTTQGIETPETRKILSDLRDKGDFALLSEMMKPIRAIDLRMVDVADFLVVNIDLEIPTCGTWEEVYWANRSKKPVIIHCRQGVKQLPHWLFGTLPYQLFFEKWSDVYDYIRHISNDITIDDLGRWRFFDFSLGRNL